MAAGRGQVGGSRSCYMVHAEAGDHLASIPLSSHVSLLQGIILYLSS